MRVCCSDLGGKPGLTVDLSVSAVLTMLEARICEDKGWVAASILDEAAD